MIRYLVASLLTPFSDQQLRRVYHQLFKESCSVHTLHLTYIPPFFLHHDNLPPLPTYLPLPPLPIISFGIFTLPRRQILYAQLDHPILYQWTSELRSQLQPSITIQTDHFPTQTEPEFLPHISLNYSYANTSFLPPIPNLAIQLQPPQILSESAPGVWVPSSSSSR